MKELLKKIIRKNNKEKKNFKIKIAKATLILVSIIISTEIFLWYLECNNIINEPYEWGDRIDITVKINECIELFSSKEHKDKIKVVIIGNSRPESAFDPILFDKFFDNKTISYSLSFAATYLPFNALIIQKIVIPQIKPDIILWDLTLPDDFSEYVIDFNEDDFESSMARYYNDNSADLDFDETCYFYLFKYSRIYRYRSLLVVDTLKLDTRKNKYIDEMRNSRTRGYFERKEVYGTNESMEEVEDSIIFKKESAKLFKKTIELINKKTAYFLVINGPYRFKKIKSDRIYNVLNNTLKHENFLDLNGNEEFNNYLLFEDPLHLNENGAKIYTKMVYEKINNTSGDWIK